MNATLIFDKLTAADEKLAQSAGALLSATLALQDSEACLQTARVECEKAKQSVLVSYAADPKALGSNEATREARLNEICADEVEALRRATDDVARDRNTLALAQLVYDADKRHAAIWQAAAGMLKAEG